MIKKQIRIVVVDSGYYPTKNSKVKLCDDGHKDFTTTGMLDNHGHGTHITNLIVSRLKESNYCIILVKWYDPFTPKYFEQNTSYRVFNYISTLKDIDIINYSAGGPGNSEEEDYVLAGLMERGIKIFVAAGNGNEDLDTTCNYYPACYKLKKLNVVGNLDQHGNRQNASNYGSIVTQWEDGTGIIQDAGRAGLIPMTGTSQACAVATAKEANRQFVVDEQLREWYSMTEEGK